MLSCLFGIWHLSAILEPNVRAGAVLASCFWLGGANVPHRLVGIGTDVVTPSDFDVALGIGFAACGGPGAGAWFNFGFGFGFGIDFSWLPGCGCWGSCGLFPAYVKSAWIEVSSPTPLVSAFLFSVQSRCVAVTVLACTSMMSLAHCTSSWWYASRFSCFSSNHLFSPRHCASGSAVSVSSMFAIFGMIR